MFIAIRGYDQGIIGKYMKVERQRAHIYGLQKARTICNRTWFRVNGLVVQIEGSTLKA